MSQHYSEQAEKILNRPIYGFYLTPDTNSKYFYSDPIEFLEMVLPEDSVDKRGAQEGPFLQKGGPKCHPVKSLQSGDVHES